MPGFLICKCEPCDALIVAELVDASPPHCPGCGAGADALTEQGTVLKGAAWRAGESKAKGRLLNVRIAYTPQRNRGGALARHERIIDRHGDRYFEKVTLCDIGLTVHLNEEPLTQHRGHGSDRQGSTKP